MGAVKAVQTVAVIVQDHAEPFGLGSLVEVWGEPEHPEDRTPVFDFRVCTPRPGRVKGRSDYDLFVDRGLEATEDADLICLAPHHDFLDHDPAVIEAIKAADARGALLFAHCSGTFELGAAGLLDGRECTTHWRYTDVLEEMYPEAKVRPDVLYCHDGNILTGAGSAAGIDASLHLMRDLYGARVAATVARRIVVPPAPRRRAGPVHRAGRARLRHRDLRAAAGVDPAEPRRGPRRRHPGPQVADVAAHLRPPVPGRDRGDARTPGSPGSACRPPRSSSSSPTTRSSGSPTRSASATPPPCATTSPACAGSRPQQYRRTFAGRTAS